jgi:hypothetical protein
MWFRPKIFIWRLCGHFSSLRSKKYIIACWIFITLFLDTLYIRDAIMTFKCVNDLAPPYLCGKLNKRQQISGRITRQSNDFQIPKCRTATGQKSFEYRSQVSIWNSLSPTAKQLSSIEHFKHYLKLRNSFLIYS